MNASSLALVGLLGVATLAQPDQTPSSTGDVAFAFADATGTALLAQVDVKEPQRLTSALCANGRRAPIRFGAKQQRGPNDSGRRTPQNFTQAEGVRFEVAGSEVERSGICLLASGAFLATATVLPLTPVAPSAACEARLRARIADARKRAVRHCWTLSRIAPDKAILLVEFARAGRNALASVILSGPSPFIFADLPGEYGAEANSVWRVDDDGELSPEAFEIIAALRRGDSYLLAVSWAGAEGASLSLYASRRDRFVTLIGDYLYWSP